MAVAASDEIACMPCTGLHKAHSGCFAKWLQQRSNCPMCRWSHADVPVEAMPGLISRAEGELQRLRDEPLPPSSS